MKGLCGDRNLEKVPETSGFILLTLESECKNFWIYSSKKYNKHPRVPHSDSPIVTSLHIYFLLSLYIYIFIYIHTHTLSLSLSLSIYIYIYNTHIILLLFSYSVMSDSLRPHGLQHPMLRFGQTPVHWVGDAIQQFHPLSSPSPPAFNLSQHQGFF